MMSAPRSGFHFYAVTLVDPLTVSDSNSPPFLSSKPHAIKKLCRQTKQHKKCKEKKFDGVWKMVSRANPMGASYKVTNQEMSRVRKASIELVSSLHTLYHKSLHSLSLSGDFQLMWAFSRHNLIDVLHNYLWYLYSLYLSFIHCRQLFQQLFQFLCLCIDTSYRRSNGLLWHYH